MRAIKVVIFLIILSLTFQGLASYSFCDFTANENSNAMMDDESMNSGLHDCCDDNPNAKDQCQCNAAVASALPEKGIVSSSNQSNASSKAFNSKLISSSFNTIFRPPRLF